MPSKSPIDPDAPIAEQIKSLEALIHGPKKAAHWITWSASLSRHVINKLSQRNRTMKPSRIKRYAKAMTDGAFLDDGETIKFGESGFLRDGQNRMAACSRSGAQFESLTVFGVREDAFAVMDTGKPRNGGDVLHITGKPNPVSRASAIRWHIIFTGPAPTKFGQDLSPSDILEAQAAIETMSSDSAEMFEDALRTAGKIHEQHPVLTVGALAALLFIYKRSEPTAIDKFIQDVFASKGTGRKMVTWLQQRAAANFGRLHPLPRNANLIMALNAYCNGKHPPREWKGWDPLARFPSIPKPK